MSLYVDYYETLAQEDMDCGVGLTQKRNPGGGTLAATQVGIHSFAIGQAAFAQAWTPGVVPAGGKVSTTVVVPGAGTQDFTLVSLDSIGSAGLQITANVQAAGVVQVVLSNVTGVPVTVTAGTLRVLVLPSR